MIAVLFLNLWLDDSCFSACGVVKTCKNIQQSTADVVVYYLCDLSYGNSKNKTQN